MTEADIKIEIEKYIQSQFFDDNETFDHETELLSSGIIDSISSLQLVSFLEETFAFEFMPHEVDQENLNTINLIAQFVKSKV